jgi:hypothetical protein
MKSAKPENLMSILHCRQPYKFTQKFMVKQKRNFTGTYKEMH